MSSIMNKISSIPKFWDGWQVKEWMPVKYPDRHPDLQISNTDFLSRFGDIKILQYGDFQKAILEKGVCYSFPDAVRMPYDSVIIRSLPYSDFTQIGDGIEISILRYSAQYCLFRYSGLDILLISVQTKSARTNNYLAKSIKDLVYRFKHQI